MFFFSVPVLHFSEVDLATNGSVRNENRDEHKESIQVGGCEIRDPSSNLWFSPGLIGFFLFPNDQYGLE